ncbi:MAG: CRISPR-associated endoribonuclease Cas6 [Caldiserica bacterium]|nr:CRISPR-associated endoribonuclease Cas6 [Caldisericota bacterium]
MRLVIDFGSERNLILPVHHNHILQGFIYSLLAPTLRKFLHEEGFLYQKRRFKLFTFSRLMGKFKEEKGKFIFNSPVKLVISSPKHEILQSVAEGILKGEEFRLHTNKVFIASINVFPRPNFPDRVYAKMLSPITIRSTLMKADGSKKTYYYSPLENEFNELIKKNLEKKYCLVYGEKPASGLEFRITPYNIKPFHEKVIIYKETVIKGWMGIYEIVGDPRLIQLSYDAGLGARNSQGFGCWEIWGRNE